MPAKDSSLRVVYKINSATSITPGSEPTFSSDPGASGGQELRVLAHQPPFLSRSNFVSQEKRSDLQKYDLRLGGKRAQWSIPFELSPKTFQDLFASLFRTTWASAVSKSNSDFTSLAFSSGI